MTTSFATLCLRELLSTDGVSETEMFYAEVTEEMNSTARRLKTGKITLTPDSFNGIVVASRLDGALRQAGLGFIIHVDWDTDVITFSCQGDHGVWGMKNWTNNPLTKHQSVDIMFNEVHVDSFRAVMMNLFGDLESIYTPRLSPVSLQSIPAQG
jgi:hypothetical protein